MTMAIVKSTIQIKCNLIAYNNTIIYTIINKFHIIWMQYTIDIFSKPACPSNVKTSYKDICKSWYLPQANTVLI